MARPTNRVSQRWRREAAERENTRMRCDKHGHFNPWQRTLGGWKLGGCPKCAADIYEAERRALGLK